MWNHTLSISVKLSTLQSESPTKGQNCIKIYSQSLKIQRNKKLINMPGYCMSLMYIQNDCNIQFAFIEIRK